MIDDVLEAIKKIPDKSISTVVTSPPYWNLRDYKDNRQIGNEKNPLEFFNKIALVWKEILRILKDDGAYFLNLNCIFLIQMVILKSFVFPIILASFVYCKQMALFNIRIKNKIGITQ